MKRTSKRHYWQGILLFLPLIAIGFYASGSVKPWIIANSAWLFPDAPYGRPQRTNTSVELFEGIVYTRQIRAQPRPLVIHAVTIDLSAPDIDFLVTPHDPGTEIGARTTTSFAQEYGVQVAVNGSYFDPFWARTPWDYYPRSGDHVRVRGLAISNGATYADALEGWPTLCFVSGRVFIDHMGCPPETAQALAGKEMLIDGGVALAQKKATLHPRTAVASTADGATLWLVVVDGRQPDYSEGVTLAELAQIILELGADVALNLDGGGSSTLVMQGAMGPELLNAPIHTNVAMRQRPVANHLGIYAPALGYSEVGLQETSSPPVNPADHAETAHLAGGN